MSARARFWLAGLWHFAYGIHSGFPLCCVLAYLLDRRTPDPHSAGYIRCARCIRADRRRLVHHCADNPRSLHPLCRLSVWLERRHERKIGDALARGASLIELSDLGVWWVPMPPALRPKFGLRRIVVRRPKLRLQDSRASSVLRGPTGHERRMT